MSKKEISPEERLLNLIRAKKKGAAEEAVEKTPEKTPEKTSEPAPKEAPEKAPAVEPQKAMVEAAISRADERISGILKSELFKSKVFEPAVLKIINRYMVAILGLIILYFLIDLIVVRPYKDVQTLVSKPVAGQNEKPLHAGADNTAIVKDYSSYSNDMPGRTVFGPSRGGPAASEDLLAAGGITDKVGLVGIITGDNPQAIIEDKKAQKTYYLNKGQSFDGYVVEEIADDKVILDCEGKKISLFL